MFCSRIRKVGSKAAVLVFLWALVVHSTGHIIFRYVIFDILDPLHAQGIPATLLIAFFGPLAGWIADIYCGRYRIIRFSLWLLSIGVTGCVVFHTFISTRVSSQVQDIIKLTFGVPLYLGYAAFVANAMQFAIDQMPEASGQEVSAFVHWYVWVTFIGRGVAKLTTLVDTCSGPSLSKSDAGIYAQLITLTMLALGVCSCALFYKCLTVIPESRNPIKTIISVLKYAASHKYPENRSALTYCEDQVPSRIDLGKSKYGGPFTTEQVEDVKTFFRIMSVILATFSIVIPFELCWTVKRDVDRHFRNPSRESPCVNQVIGDLYSTDFIIGICIPLYELVIYPLARNRIPKMLQRSVLAAVLIVFFSIFLLTIDAVGHYLSDAACMFVDTDEKGALLPINYFTVLVPFQFIFSIIIMLYRISLFEFICAQSPYNMKGLLLGMGYSVLYLGEGIAIFLQAIWRHIWRNAEAVTSPSCGFWYFLTSTILATLALVLMILVARSYKQRQRDEPNNDQWYVEDYYNRCSERDDSLTSASEQLT